MLNTVFTHTYSNVNLPAAVGGNTAWVGFTAGTGGRRTEQNVLDWTYSTNGSTVVDHANGFDNHGDLTANEAANFVKPVIPTPASGNTMLPIVAAQLTPGDGRADQRGSVFTNQQVNISNFHTEFTILLHTGSEPPGEGMTFTIQAQQGHPSQPNYGDTVVRLSPTPGSMTVSDYFVPPDFPILQGNLDLGSGGVMLLDFPGTAHPHLAVATGKGNVIYVLDRDHLGGVNGQLQAVKLGNDYGVWGAPAYANGKIYYQDQNNVLKAFQFVLDPATNTMVLTPSPVTQGLERMPYPNMTPAVSSNGGSNGIVWGVQANGSSAELPSILHAYDPNDLSHELYSSNLTPRDQAGAAVSFVTPIIVNGKVYFGTQNELDVYGLMPQGRMSLRPSQIHRSRPAR